MYKKSLKNAVRALACFLASSVLTVNAVAEINPEISDKQPRQQDGQLQGQLNWIRKTIQEGANQRVFQKETLANVNFPLSGIGTGIVYFNGNLVPYKWDIGKMKLEDLMAENTLFAVITESEGKRDGVVLRNNNKLNDRNAFSDMPARGNSNGGSTKQGSYFINSSLFAPNYDSYNDTRIGELRSRKIRIPRSAAYLAALVGGGRNSGKNLDLLYLGIVDANTGDVYVSLSGDDAENMRTKRARIPEEVYGKDVYVVITDKSANDWGHINVDDIRFENDLEERIEVPGFENGDFENKLEGWTIVGSDFNNGLPVCSADQVKAVIEYPFGFYDFDPNLPVDIQLQMFNPMIPLNERDSAIPAGMFNVVLKNTSDKEVKASVLSTLTNGMYGKRSNRVVANENGTYILMTNDIRDGEIGDGVLALWTPGRDAAHSAGQKDAKALYHQAVAGSLDGKKTAEDLDAVGGLMDSIVLKPGETKSVQFAYVWYFPNFFADNLWGNSHVNIGRWYASFYNDIEDVIADISKRFDILYRDTMEYHDSMYDTTLPYYIPDAAASTMDVLRSPTFYVAKDGTPYGWEGSDGRWGAGYCHGNCQHVWNYAEGFFNLFPKLAGTWKKIDFTIQQSPYGLLFNRMGNVPPQKTGEEPAIDGTLGSIMLAWRLHQNMQDSKWLKELWPNIRKCMNAAIQNWDPNEDGINERSANMTYDKWMGGTTVRINAMYLGALKACEYMAAAVGDTKSQQSYRTIYEKGPDALDKLTWNGEYYEQVGKINGSNEGTIGAGLLTDNLLGQTHMYLYGLGELLDPLHMRSQVNSAFKYNFYFPVGAKYRPEYNSADRIYALPDDPATLVCTWPKGGSGSLLYASEDWSGTSYTNAINMIYMGNIQKALATVWSVRSRYDGKDMDPLNERELGSYYARSMAAYGLIEAASGIEKNGPDGMLGFNPKIDPENYRGFYNTATSWGSATQSRQVSGSKFTQKNSVNVRYGNLPLKTYRLYLPVEIYPSFSDVQVSVKVDGKNVQARISEVDSDGCIAVNFDNLTLNRGSVIEFATTGQVRRDFSFTDEFLFGDMQGWKLEKGLAMINDTSLLVVPEDGETLLSRNYLLVDNFEMKTELSLSSDAVFGWCFGDNCVYLKGDGSCQILSGNSKIGDGTGKLTGEIDRLTVKVKNRKISVYVNEKKIASAMLPKNAGSNLKNNQDSIDSGIRGNCAMQLSGEIEVDTLSLKSLEKSGAAEIYNNRYMADSSKNKNVANTEKTIALILWVLSGAVGLFLIGGGIFVLQTMKKQRSSHSNSFSESEGDNQYETGNPGNINQGKDA